MMRILYLGLKPQLETYRRIIEGELPTDRLYGIVELQNLGYDVSLSHLRPEGAFSFFLTSLNTKFGFNLTDLKTLINLRNFDVIIVNGPFSTLVTLACRIMGKKIVYLDTILRLPKNSLKILIYKFNLIYSNGTIMYSKAQIKLCLEKFNVSVCRFKLIPFTIDVSFTQKFNLVSSNKDSFVLAIGRDQARDYKTLIDAMDGLNIKLKLVTLPYLLKGLNLNHDWIEVFENVSYKELYQLYIDALFVVIPLKKWGTLYSSGTRGLLEAMALGKSVIASHSQPLEEYLGLDDGVLYVEPENAIDMRDKISELLVNSSLKTNAETRGKESAEKRFNMNVFASTLGNYLESLFESSENDKKLMNCAKQ